MLQAGEFEHDFSHQAVAVGVQAAGSDADHDVVGGDVAAVDDAIALDHADGEAGQVVAAVLEHVGQDGGFAAQQGAIGLQAAVADAGDDLLQQRRIVVRHGHVVEEEQRLGAAAQHVVDAHGHQVDADGVVAAGQLGDLELRADAVGATDQHRVFVAAGEQPVGEIELEQAGESAGQRHHARA